MSGAAWFPVAIGLGGVLLGVFVIVAIPFGLFNRLLRVRPAPGITPLSADILLQRLLALDDHQQPWTIRPAPDDRHADLIAEWRIADNRWWGLFQRNSLRRSYRAYIRLDASSHEVRITESSGSVTWSAGTAGVVPQVHWEARFFRGVVLFERAREIAYGLAELLPPRPAEVVAYDFDPWRVKGPILRAAVESGWTYAPVVHAYQLGSKPAYRSS